MMSEYEAVIKAIDTIMSFYYTHEAGGTTCTWVSDIDGVVLHTDWGYFEQGLEEIKGYCEMLEVKAKKLADRKTEPQTERSER